MDPFIKELKERLNTFSLSQMTSNSDGKTSSTGTMGCLTIFVGLICFVVGIIDFIAWTKSTDIMLQSLALIGAGHTMLIYRKSKENNVIKDDIAIDDKVDTPIPDADKG